MMKMLIGWLRLGILSYPIQNAEMRKMVSYSNKKFDSEVLEVTAVKKRRGSIEEILIWTQLNNGGKQYFRIQSDMKKKYF